MTITVFRCDASLNMGSGHVIRCRSLARQLIHIGSTVIFLCRSQQGDLIHVLSKEFVVLTLPNVALKDCSDATGRDLYLRWLGTDQISDADACLSALKSAGVTDFNWLVIDHYGLDRLWEEHFISNFPTKSLPKVLAIDDLADRDHSVNILLDQNYFSSTRPSRYSDFVPSSCKCLLGPTYALLNPEYSLLHESVPFRSEMHRVLLYFGGCDPFNLTIKALLALTAPQFANISVDIVLGIQSSDYDSIEQLANKRPKTWIHHSLPTLCGLIARADLSIGAGGSTTWERACLGLPSIVITTSDNQKYFNLDLANDSYTTLINDPNVSPESKIISALECYLDDPSFLNSRSRSCHGLVDGFGVRRVVSNMLAYDD